MHILPGSALRLTQASRFEWFRDWSRMDVVISICAEPMIGD
jgi:hypothetical protein